MICPRCHKEIKENDKYYKCQCAIIWKSMSGKTITPEIVQEILKNGQTTILDGFVSKTGKPFRAKLVLQGNKVAYEFEDKHHKQEKSKDWTRTHIRIESGSSGTVYIEIEDMFTGEVNYGLVSSRMAECLGTISAVNLIQYRRKELPNLSLSLNNLDFSRYLLRERTPRDKAMRQSLDYLWVLLGAFPAWQAKFEPRKRPRLQGSPQAVRFPQGLYPYLVADVQETGKNLIVRLPNSPDIQAQFKASIRKAEALDDNSFQVPIFAKSVVDAWLTSVKT